MSWTAYSPSFIELRANDMCVCVYRARDLWIVDLGGVIEEFERLADAMDCAERRACATHD